jgi:hypothetical protein
MLGTQFEQREASGAGWCCDACEWVHSTLDIHCADWLCCIGTCPPMHLTDRGPKVKVF